MIKWQATDKWGWELSKCGQRDLKISNILEENVDFDINYKITLHRPGDLYNVSVWLEGNFISFNSMTDGSISIKLPCKSFKDADNLVEMVCQANNLKIMSAYIS
jgi:hypothetical protein